MSKEHPSTAAESQIYDEQLVAKLLQLIRNGCTISSACSVAGISHRTYRRWKERGSDDYMEREDYEVYRTFRERALEAEAMFDARLDVELAKRVETMDTKDLLRFREMRARHWDTQLDKTLRIEHANDPNNPLPEGNKTVQIIAFTPEVIAEAERTLIEAGIGDKVDEIVIEEDG